MATLPNQLLPANTFILVPVVDIDFDGSTVDTTEVLTVTSDNGSIASAIVNPSNPRQIKITGLPVAAGLSTMVRIGAPGVPSEGMLLVPVTITAPPNLSRIDLAAGGVQGPFPV